MLIFFIFYFLNGFFQKVFLKQDLSQNFSSFIFINSSNEVPENKNKVNNNTNSITKQTTNSAASNTSSQNKTTNSITKNSTSANNVNTNSAKLNAENNTTNKNKEKSSSSTTNNVNKTVEVKLDEWRIVIPSIDLNAPISEGTSVEVMNKFVGHFENTDLWNGNVALAAHNRGYPVNFFANIKKLQKGEIIEYYYQGNLREYKIETIVKIQDTDWTYLSKTTDNRITLITCVEDEPEYRRCIQGIEI